MRTRRRIPRGDDDLALLIALTVAGVIGWEWWTHRQAPQGGESVNYPSGGVLGVTSASNASGVVSYTSHPSGKGQIYA